jgi:hypothetical protein
MGTGSEIAARSKRCEQAAQNRQVPRPWIHHCGRRLIGAAKGGATRAAALSPANRKAIAKKNRSSAVESRKVN